MLWGLQEGKKSILKKIVCVSCKFGGENVPEEGVAFELDFRVMAWFEQIEAGLMD